MFSAKTKPARRIARFVALALVLAGALFLAFALYIPAKAKLAQILLERAWAEAQTGATAPKPWPWADTWPVGAIEVPRLGQRAIVLESASGEALAFGPGHMAASVAIGGTGTAIVAGHRDTHFRFLALLVPGDILFAYDPSGARHRFRVRETFVVHARASGLEPTDPGATGARLALVTCYPFDAVGRGPLRYVVLAERASELAS